MDGRGRGFVAAALAVVLAVVVVAPAGASGGGDQGIWSGGGDLGMPWGYARVYFRNDGTEPLVGRTTVVAEVGSGPLRFTNAAFFPAGGPFLGDTLAGSGLTISPDGKRLTYFIDGTNAPGRAREVRVHFVDNWFMQPSSYRITFSHPDDANPANDSLGYGPNPPPPPTTTTTTTTVP